MATKFKLRVGAQQKLNEQREQRTRLVETLMQLHDNNIEQTIACMEGVVEILGSMVARMNAGKSPIDQEDPKKQRVLLGILAGAKTLMDHPEAAEGFNLTPIKLRQLMSLVGDNTNATKMLLQIAQAAPTVVSEVVGLFKQYDQAIQNKDQQTATAIKQQLQKLWMYWQKALPQQRVA